MEKSKLAYQTNCWGSMGGDAVGVTSISRLTYRTYADMARAIDDIAAVGYQGIEMFDGNLLDYEGRINELRGLLDGAGVQLVAAYSGANFIFSDILPEELARLARVADAAAEAGALHLVVGGGAKRAAGVMPGDFPKLASALDEVKRIAAARGLTAHYHPHLSTIVETLEQVREIFGLTSIHFCPDTAHLVASGADLPQMIHEYKDRISYIHLKGWQRDPFAFTPLDVGDLDVAAIVRALDEVGYQGWITTELDAWEDPKAGAQRSYDFLRRHQQGAGSR
jgi:inosose dehydratase